MDVWKRKVKIIKIMTNNISGNNCTRGFTETLLFIRPVNSLLSSFQPSARVYIQKINKCIYYKSNWMPSSRRLNLIFSCLFERWLLSNSFCRMWLPSFYLFTTSRVHCCQASHMLKQFICLSVCLNNYCSEETYCVVKTKQSCWISCFQCFIWMKEKSD